MLYVKVEISDRGAILISLQQYEPEFKVKILVRIIILGNIHNLKKLKKNSRGLHPKQKCVDILNDDRMGTGSSIPDHLYIFICEYILFNHKL